MPSLSADAQRHLAAYLRFQRALGVERLRIFPAVPLQRYPLSSPPPNPEPFLKLETETSPAPPRLPAGPSESLEAILTDLGPDCRRCKLSALGRHTIVFGSGNPHAELVFVGEGPGADEDAQGLPFVGRGGQLLTDMIQKGMGLRREDVYICNVVKCRPPGNRTPEADEIAACSPFLLRQLRAIAPRVVCALGATAAQLLRPYKGSLTSVRGRIHALPLGDFESRLVVTYHPAYLLRDPSQKREAWKDLQLIMEYLKLPQPARGAS